MILYYISIFVLLSHSIRDYGLFRGLFFINLSVFFLSTCTKTMSCCYCGLFLTQIGH